MHDGLKIRWQTLPGPPLPLPGTPSFQPTPPLDSPSNPPARPLDHPSRDPFSPEAQKTKNENALFGGIGELGGSGWRGSIRLVKLVWLVLPKKIGSGPKGPIHLKR